MNIDQYLWFLGTQAEISKMSPCMIFFTSYFALQQQPSLGNGFYVCLRMTSRFMSKGMEVSEHGRLFPQPNAGLWLEMLTYGLCIFNYGHVMRHLHKSAVQL